MKLKHLFFNALAVMVFAACSSEAEEIKPADKTQETPVVTINLEMSGDFQLPTVQYDGTRALTLDLDEDYPPFTNEEGVTDWKTHCFLRNADGTAQFYALVDWNATTNNDGSITLNIKESALNLLPSGDLIGLSESELAAKAPKAGERWYIAGMTGGGVLDDTRTKVDFTVDEFARPAEVLPANALRIPLAFAWTPFTVSKKMGERAPRISVQFQPKGSLIHVRVSPSPSIQLPDGGTTFNVSCVSNSFDCSGHFDYALSTAGLSEPKWTWNEAYNWSGNSALMSRLKGQRITSGETKSLIYWGMNRPLAEIPEGKVRTEILLMSHQGNVLGSTDVAQKRSRVFENGMSYVYFFELGRPKMSLENLAESNVADNGGTLTFVSSPTSTSGSTFYTFEQAVNTFDPAMRVHIDGYRYKLPQVSFWRSILPENTFGYNVLSDRSNLQDGDSQYGGHQSVSYALHGTQSDFTVKSTGLAYGLRFKGGPSNNYFRTAYRYQVVSDVSGQEHIKITSRYLGANFSGSITTIADDVAFWNVNNSEDVTRYFPLTGFYANDADALQDKGSKGGLWANMNIVTTYSSQRVFSLNPSLVGPIAVVPSATAKYPVRLVRN